MGDKTCTKCLETKPLSEYHKDSRAVDGKFSHCKVCENARRKAKYEADKPGHKEQNDRYRAKDIEAYNARKVKTTTKWNTNNPEKRAQVRAKCQLKQILKHPNRYAARQAVAYAKKCGELIAEPCEVCGEEKVQAHHDCYKQENWLNVRWLCSKHHGEHHAQ